MVLFIDLHLQVQSRIAIDIINLCFELQGEVDFFDSW